MKTHNGSWPWLLTLAVISLAAGTVEHVAAFVHISYLLVALVACCAAYAWLSLRRLEVAHQSTTVRTSVGDRVLEVYHARSEARWPILGITVESHPGVARGAARWSLSMGARGHEEWTAVSTATRRGRYKVGVGTVSVADPFGVMNWRRAQAALTEIVVHPRPRFVPDFDLAMARAGDVMAAQRSWVRMPVSGAVRPFAAGDSSTRIHWLSSVHHGVLMVKASDRSAGQRVWVALDLESSGHAGYGAESTIEYGVEAAAYVLEMAFNAGLDAGLILTGSEIVIAQPARGRDQRDYLFDLLATARAGHGPGLADTIENTRAARPTDAVVILTPVVPVELIDLCARLRRLGCGVTAVLLDASTFGGDCAADRTGLDAERIPTYTVRRFAL